MNVLLAMENASKVVGSYVITFVGIAVFVWRIFAAARRSAARVAPEDRPWT